MCFSDFIAFSLTVPAGRQYAFTDSFLSSINPQTYLFSLPFPLYHLNLILARTLLSFLSHTHLSLSLSLSLSSHRHAVLHVRHRLLQQSGEVSSVLLIDHRAVGGLQQQPPREHVPYLQELSTGVPVWPCCRVRALGVLSFIS